MAPEVIEQSTPDFSNDLFSFGGIMYRMMKNKDRVLYLDAISGKLNSILKEELSENFSSKLIEIVCNLTSLNPNERMNSKEVLDLLISIE